jgi:hypothetical protein
MISLAMKPPHRLLCYALVVMLSSTGWAEDDSAPRNKDGDFIYVRFHTDYEGVGMYGGVFQKGDVARVTKKIDAYYFEASTDLRSKYGRKARWDKVDIVTKEQAYRQREQEYGERRAQERVSERRRMASVILEAGVVDKVTQLSELSETELSEVYEFAKQAIEKRAAVRAAQYPKNLFMGWDENGQPITGTHTGGGNYFAGWDKNGQPINRRANSTGQGKYFMGWDENGQPITGQ